MGLRLPAVTNLRLPLAIMALGVLLVSGGGWSVYQDIRNERRTTLAAAHVQAENLTRVLEDHLHQTIRRIDQTILHLRQEYQGDPDHFIIKARAWQQSAYADLALQVSIIAPNGKLLFNNLNQVTEPINLSDREHFIIHRDRNDDLLYISKPVLGRVSQKWSIQFTRPLHADNGTFNGVIVLSVDVDFLSRFYQSVDLSHEGSVILVGADRVIRARGSTREQETVAIGRELPLRDFFLPTAPPAGPLRLTSAVDGLVRVGAYRRLKEYPLFVNVLYSEREILAPMDQHARNVVIGSALIGALVLAIFYVTARLVHRQEQGKRQLEDARNRLAALEERWRLALESVGDGVWDWNIVTGETYFSPRWKAMLGFAEDELPHHVGEWEKRVHPADRAAVMADVAKMLNGEDRFYINEHRVCCKDGNFKWVLDRGVVVARDDKGVALRAVGTHTDITRRREIEEALRQKTEALENSNRELEAFAYVASHDLRQPLRTVNSYLTLLVRELDGATISADAGEFIGFIKDGVHRMDRLIVDLLEYSRVGRKEAPFVAQPAADLINEAMLNLDVAIKESGATIIRPDNAPIIRGDHSELVRLFQNLIGNAVKYRASGRQPLIRIECRPDSEKFWRFSVHDNGVGIAAEHHERVFGIFQRLHAASEVEGSGIGLALCKKIVEHHGGRIWLTSIPGEGSVFRFTLPTA